MTENDKRNALHGKRRRAGSIGVGAVVDLVALAGLLGLIRRVRSHEVAAWAARVSCPAVLSF